MGWMTRQVGSELRQLPLILGKLLGGMFAVLGFGAAAFMASRPPGAASPGLLPGLLAGTGGLILFILTGRALARREAKQPPAATGGQSRLAWALLLLFVLLFLAGGWLLSR